MSDIDDVEALIIPPETTISIVATSDVHGNVLNWDYSLNKAPRIGLGLAKVSTYVKGLKTANPSNVMLIDNGDTIQGTPLVYYYNMIDKTTVNPMATVMGEMKYDTLTLGNHEFNYGLPTLNREINEFKDQGIQILSANIYHNDNTNFVGTYFIKSFTQNKKLVKVGILGLTTKTVPNWEDPVNYAGLKFNDLVTQAQKWVPIVKAAGADVVIVAAHSGEERDTDVIPENQIKALATSVNGIDVIVAGHTHATLNDLSLRNPSGRVVPVLQPGKFAEKVSQIDLNYDKNGNLTVVTKNVIMESAINEDPVIVQIIASYHSKTLAHISTKLGISSGVFSGLAQITKPTEIMELINKIQANAAGTQLSIAAPLHLSPVLIPAGEISIKDIMGAYAYENFLYGIKMTGRQLKDWMEYAARYYKQISGKMQLVVKSLKLNIADYNLDQLYGATYEIDLNERACTLDTNGRVISGNRIKNLRFNGKLIKDFDVFTVAINNYRYNGGGAFMTATGISNTDSSLVIYDSEKSLGDDGQVRTLMMKYVKDNKVITPTTSNNWKIKF